MSEDVYKELYEDIEECVPKYKEVGSIRMSIECIEDICPYSDLLIGCWNCPKFDNDFGKRWSCPFEMFVWEFEA